SMSCSKFLDTKPKDFISPTTYYNTEEQLTAALMGVYDQLGVTGTYGKYLVIELPLSTDEGLPRDQSGVRPYLYNHSAASKEIDDCWKALYTGINRANLLLENIESSPVEQTIKDKIKGEA